MRCDIYEHIFQLVMAYFTNWTHTFIALLRFAVCLRATLSYLLSRISLPDKRDGNDE